MGRLALPECNDGKGKRGPQYSPSHLQGTAIRRENGGRNVVEKGAIEDCSVVVHIGSGRCLGYFVVGKRCNCKTEDQTGDLIWMEMMDLR